MHEATHTHLVFTASVPPLRFESSVYCFMENNFLQTTISLYYLDAAHLGAQATYYPAKKGRLRHPEGTSTFDMPS